MSNKTISVNDYLNLDAEAKKAFNEAGGSVVAQTDAIAEDAPTDAPTDGNPFNGGGAGGKA